MKRKFVLPACLFGFMTVASPASLFLDVSSYFFVMLFFLSPLLSSMLEEIR